MTDIAYYIFLIIFGLFAVAGITGKYNHEAKLKECYLQTIKTDDCKYILWKYEQENVCKRKEK